MTTILKAAYALALATGTPAAASTLVLYDINAPEGERIVSSPYADQEFSRMTRQGLLRPVTIHMDDSGIKQTAVVDVSLPTPTPPLGIGVRILTHSTSWQVSTQRSGDQFSYEAIIRNVQGFVNGITPPTQVTGGDTTLVGVANISNEGRPAFARRYAAPSGERILIGYVLP